MVANGTVVKLGGVLKVIVIQPLGRIRSDHIWINFVSGLPTQLSDQHMPPVLAALHKTLIQTVTVVCASLS